MSEMKTIYIRQLRFEEAKKKFHQEIEKAFMAGYGLVEVVHGVGTYTLRRMVETEIERIEYVRHFDSGFHDNPGSIKLEILGPDPHLLKKYT